MSQTTPTNHNQNLARTGARFAHPWVARLVLAALSPVAALALLELLLRVLPIGRPASPPRDRPLIAFYPSETRLNPWSDNHPDPLRIAVVGDSITNATGCQVYDAYSMRLEALMNHNDGQRPAEVMVWARGGDSTHTELRHLESILAWEPDLLILGICLNDTEDPTHIEEYKRWRVKALPPPPSPGLAKVLRHTRVGTSIYQRLAARKARDGYLAYYRHLYDKDYRGWRLFVRAIRSFRDACQEHGITFVPVVFPLFSDVDRYPFDWVHEQIADALREEGIVHLDLLESFRGQSPQRLQAIPFVDPHPNEIAHRQAAEAIFHFLIANKMVDDEYLPEHANASPERMWKILDRFINDVVSVDADVTERLIESDDESEPELQ